MNLASEQYFTFNDLTHTFGEITALNEISGDIPRNSICGFIGPDGAGKSTFLNLVVGLSKPNSGEISFSDADARASGRIGYMPQQFSLYQDLTVSENLLLFARLYGVNKKIRSERYQHLLKFSRLENFTNRRAENLSGGMKQKLALICVLMYSPPLLVLDEPTTGVDPMARTELWEMLHQLKSDGHTILVSTPYMEEAVQCDRVFFMTDGQVLATDTPANLQQEYRERLYEIHTSRVMELLETFETLDWIQSVYPMGDRLHLSVADSSLDEEWILKKIQKAAEPNDSVQRIDPGMEDVYASLEASR